MPELAEVEYVARQLQEHIIGACITAVEIRQPSLIKQPDSATFMSKLSGHTITQVNRRGKILIISLSNDMALTIHRGMSGNVHLLAPDEAEGSHCHIVLDLADGRRLIYTDPRRFGALALFSCSNLANHLAYLGPEPLDVSFTAERLSTIVRKSNRMIKAFLLDQSKIAGLGNIYADEALYYASIHPLRPANSLSTDEIVKLHAGIRHVLETGISHGGTTFGRHRGLFGEKGQNFDHLKVYQRVEQSCERCGTTILRVVVAQRSTHFCPRCQIFEQYQP
jgi:formamidopyrimidine-DNA glycosylase